MGRRRKRKPQGFSGPGSKPVVDLLSMLTGIRGGEKRQALNILSIWIAGAASFCSGIVGCQTVYEEGYGAPGSWIVGVAIAMFVFSATMRWLGKDRCFRP